MKLSEIIKDENVEIIETRGDLDVEITDIQNNSRLINKKGTLFFAIKGFLDDGIKYLDDAISRGATAAIVEEDAVVENKGISVVRVKDVRKAMAYISKDFYNDPTRKVKTIGVTGSKGKTSITFILQRMLTGLGHKVGVIGTIGAYIDGEFFMSASTTSPESFRTNYILDKMIKQGIDVAIIEISSQALIRHRIDGMKFDITTFTNFSEDHVSPTEHKTLEDYYNCKKEIAKLGKTIVLNSDDEAVARAKCEIEKECNNEKNIITFGTAKDSSVRIVEDSIRYNRNGTKFEMSISKGKDPIEYTTTLLGKIYVSNIACAAAVATQFGITEQVIQKEIEKLKLPSRFEFIENDLGIDIVIDYAHTEESLRQALTILRHIAKGKIYALWGLSGQRDIRKRPLMGKVSGELADVTVITSENPMFEDPMDIAKAIAEGVEQANGEYFIENDRAKAIKMTLDLAKPGDMVALLGLGEERSQQFGMQVNYFNEKEVVQEYLEERKK